MNLNECRAGLLLAVPLIPEHRSSPEKFSEPAASVPSVAGGYCRGNGLCPIETSGEETGSITSRMVLRSVSEANGDPGGRGVGGTRPAAAGFLPILIVSEVIFSGTNQTGGRLVCRWGWFLPPPRGGCSGEDRRSLLQKPLLFAEAWEVERPLT